MQIGPPMAPGAAASDRGRPTAGGHVPVLLDRVLELLEPALSRPAAQRDAVHVDATLGLGGHAEAVLAAHPRLVLIGLDRDTEALARATDRLAPYASRTHLVHAVYDELPDVLDRLGYDAIDGALFDLGVSSLQLDRPERGFAYAQDAPLDMRMDQTRGVTAEQVVNEYPPGELTRILRVYGEETLRAPGRVGHRPGDGPRRASSRRRTWPTWSGTRSRRRRDAPAATRRSVRSRRCASRSTASCRRWRARCRPLWTRSRRAAGWSSCPTTRSRTALRRRRSLLVRNPPPRSICRSRRPAPSRSFAS